MSYRKPWDAEGISRATWYRRHRKTIGETAEMVSHTSHTPVAAETAETAETVETAGETAPETMQPPPDASATRDNLVMAALEARYAGHTPERRQQAIEDAQKYQAKWGEGPQRAEWTAAQEANLIWQLCGREVKQLTSAQALVGNKVIYRSQLGA
jgi:hypothetical protein